MSFEKLVPSEWASLDVYKTKDSWWDSVNQEMVYTTRWIDMYGLPDDLFKYRVIESDQDYGLDFDDETQCYETQVFEPCYNHVPGVSLKTQKMVDKEIPSDLYKKVRDTHFFCRLEHFKTILQHLMGYCNKIPQHILSLIPSYIGRDEDPWEVCFHILKKNNYQIYYNRIPTILRDKGLIISRTDSNEHKWQKVIDDFTRMHIAWPYFKTTRKYFFHIRYVALKLITKHGISLPCTIPYARTEKKFDNMEEEYDKLWEFINKNYTKNTRLNHRAQCRHCRHECIVF